MKKLSIKDGSVLLDDVELRQCTQIDLKNINPGSPMEVVLHVAVDEVDIRYSVTQMELNS